MARPATFERFEPLARKFIHGPTKAVDQKEAERPKRHNGSKD
jgi:hypothetical protein